MPSTLTIDVETMLSSERNYACFPWLLGIRTSFSDFYYTGKEKKRVDKTVASAKDTTAESHGITPERLREALEQIKNEESPSTPDEKEAYFMSQVGMGEQLSVKGAFLSNVETDSMRSLMRVVLGPAFYLAAAMSFFRALRVYPSPVELIVIYQKTVPEPIFKV